MSKEKIIQSDIDLESLLTLSPGYIYWKNLDSVYLGCNQNVATLLGLATPEEIIGKTDFDLPWGNILEIPQKAINDDKQVLKSGKPLVTEDHMGITSETGLEIVLKTEKKPLFGREGNIIGILALSIDISAEKEAERLKVENVKYETLIKKNEALNNFLDSMFRDYHAGLTRFLREDIGITQPIDHLDIELTPRESQILYLLYHKYNPKTIADYISKKSHKIISHDSINALINKRLYIKFQVNSIDKLVEKAILLKMIPLLYPDSEKVIK